jgi:Ricin-type beta-trefoil lectin domain
LKRFRLMAAATITVSVLGLCATAAPSHAAAGDYLSNAQTGRCLDDSTANGKDVLRGYPCLYNTYQTWITIDNGDGTLTYKNQATGRCLDDSTASGNDVLRGYPCNGLSYQRWFPGENYPNPYNTVSLQNIATSRCLDDSGGTSSDLLRGFSCISFDQYQQWAERTI